VPAAGDRSALGEDGAHRVVELADAGEASGEGQVGHGQLGRLDQYPGGLGALGPGQRQRPRTHAGHQQALDLARTVPEPASQARDALSVDHAVSDEPHGPAYHVGSRVHSGDPGVASGRQRLQARKPASWAVAAME